MLLFKPSRKCTFFEIMPTPSEKLINTYKRRFEVNDLPRIIHKVIHDRQTQICKRMTALQIQAQ
jgi:hypothetical protein